jgi:high affinity cGMP-specific 3',5'-cyclic phosphodiesterase 9
MLFIILQNNAMNIFRNVPTTIYRDIRKGIIRCILATDMAKHGEIMGAFRKLLDSFDYEDAEHKSLLLQMVIKCSDISNEVRPTSVSEPWVDCLLEEFFTQSDREKAEGLPTAPFMDREKVTKPSAQIGFIGFVMVPLFELVSKVLPEMDDAIIKPIKKSLAYYKDIQDKATAAST